MVSEDVAGAGPGEPGAPAQGSKPPEITTRGVVFPADWPGVVDLLFDDQRVFSVSPASLELRQGRRRMPWPRPLRRFLHGETVVTVRSSVTGEVLASEHLRFDDEPGRVRVADADGMALSLDKWGDLVAPFEADPPEKALMLSDAEEILDLLNGELGLPAFIAYGTLLGAVRAGKVMGHDTDVDIAYYSSHEHPADVMRESLDLERRLRDRGWTTHRRTGGFIQLAKADPQGPARKVDLFVAFHCNGWFSLHKWVRGRLPREAVLPLGQVVLEGRALPAPRDPEAVLALTYGESWRIPDPSFAFDYSPDIKGPSEAWFGGTRRGKAHWRQTLRRGTPLPELPEHPRGSAFAHRVESVLEAGTAVIDIGCGSGEDALWLARDGRAVVGVDYIEHVCRHAREAAASRGLPARFELVSLYDLRQVLAFATRTALTQRDAVIYARHLLEALDSDGRLNFWLLARAALGRGGRVHVEFFTPRSDDGSPKRPPAHLRRGLEPDVVIAEIARRGGRIQSEELLVEQGHEVCRLAVVLG